MPKTKTRAKAKRVESLNVSALIARIDELQAAFGTRLNSIAEKVAHLEATRGRVVVPLVHDEDDDTAGLSGNLPDAADMFSALSDIANLNCETDETESNERCAGGLARSLAIKGLEGRSCETLRDARDGSPEDLAIAVDEFLAGKLPLRDVLVSETNRAREAVENERGEAAKAREAMRTVAHERDDLKEQLAAAKKAHQDDLDRSCFRSDIQAYLSGFDVLEWSKARAPEATMAFLGPLKRLLESLGKGFECGDLP